MSTKTQEKDPALCEAKDCKHLGRVYIKMLVDDNQTMRCNLCLGHFEEYAHMVSHNLRRAQEFERFIIGITQANRYRSIRN